jgi:hypothetical protein
MRSDRWDVLTIIVGTLYRSIIDLENEERSMHQRYEINILISVNTYIVTEM